MLRPREPEREQGLLRFVCDVHDPILAGPEVTVALYPPKHLAAGLDRLRSRRGEIGKLRPYRVGNVVAVADVEEVTRHRRSPLLSGGSTDVSLSRRRLVRLSAMDPNAVASHPFRPGRGGYASGRIRRARVGEGGRGLIEVGLKFGEPFGGLNLIHPFVHRVHANSGVAPIPNGLSAHALRSGRGRRHLGPMPLPQTPGRPRREPMLHLPRVVTVVIVALLGLHAVRTGLLSPDEEVQTLLDFALVPARWTVALDPARADDVLREAAEGGRRGLDLRLALARYVLGERGRRLDRRPTYALLHGSWTHVDPEQRLARRLRDPGRAALRRPALRRSSASAPRSAAASPMSLLHPFSVAPLIGASAAVSGMMAAAAWFMFAPSVPGARARPGDEVHERPRETLRADPPQPPRRPVPRGLVRDQLPVRSAGEARSA